MEIKTAMYGGKVEMIFESYHHIYTVNDPENNVFNEQVGSVTKANGIIAKPQLINWSANITADTMLEQLKPGVAYDEIQINTMVESARNAHFNKKKEAGDIGTMVHKWVEAYIKGENPGRPVNTMLQTSIDLFLKWEKEHNVKFLLSEQPVYSRKYKFTGTLDFVCMYKGKKDTEARMYVGDLKTSSGIWDEYLLQTAAYRYARNEEFPEEKYAGMLIVRIGKDGKFEFGIIRDESWFREMFVAFIAALKLSEKMTKIKSFKLERD